jgi:hypothetical protein
LWEAHLPAVMLPRCIGWQVFRELRFSRLRFSGLRFSGLRFYGLRFC